MTPLGKSLVFYLKYWAEMEQLTPAGERARATSLPDLPDRERVLSMAQAVSVAARKEASVFLDACADAMRKSFSPFSNFQPVQRRKPWETKAEVSLPYRKGKLRVAAFIRGDKRLLVPWVRCRGGRRVADEMSRILGIAASSEVLVAYPRIALGTIPLFTSPCEGFDVDSEPLVREVGELFATLTREKLETILALQATADEPT